MSSVQLHFLTLLFIPSLVTNQFKAHSCTGSAERRVTSCSTSCDGNSGKHTCPACRCTK